jgi:hypothetical protein
LVLATNKPLPLAQLLKGEGWNGWGTMIRKDQTRVAKNIVEIVP